MLYCRRIVILGVLGKVMRAWISNHKISRDSAILSISYGLAAIYWYRSSNATVLDVLAKVSSTALLTYYAARTDSKQMTAGMLFHCFGDGLIELPGKSLIPAMLTFLVGHSINIARFQKNRFSLSELNLPRVLAMAAFTIYGAAFTHLLTTKTSGVIQYAIPIYSLAISTMFLLACIQKERSLRVFLGALLYVASDNIIGANLFVKKIPGANYLSWPLYFLGQRMMLPDPHDVETVHKKSHPR